MPGLDHVAVGHDCGEVEHVVAHRAVTHGVGARGAGRGHAAEGGLGAGIDREEQAGVAEMLVEHLAGDARLDDAVEVLRVDGEHPVHAGEVDRHPAARGIDVALERRADAEGDHRHPVGGADLDDLDHVVGRFGEDHGVRRLVGEPGEGMTVLAPHRLGTREARAEALRQNRQRRDEAGLVAGNRFDHDLQGHPISRASSGNNSNAP